MKSLNPAELSQAAKDLMEKLQGAQLQEVYLGPKGPLLSFWRQGVFTLYIDLTPVSPLILFFEGKGSVPRQKATKPVLLFLKSHGVNKLFDLAWVDPSKGRVLNLRLKGESSFCDLELRLFPHGQNLIVSADGKKVSWLKPKELSHSGVDSTEFEVVRRLDELAHEFSSERKKAQGPKKQGAPQGAQALKKTIKTIKKLEQELDRREALNWEAVGQKLLVQQSLGDASPEFEPYLDRGQSLAWNIENCFDKAKDNRKKISNLKDRLACLREDQAKLERGETAQNFPSKTGEPSIGSRLMQKSGAKGRKLNLGEGAEAIIGKSAKDNLNLLRRAQAWDLWLHLRDFPGAHAIVRRNKKRELSDKELREISAWLVSESLGRGPKTQAGEVYAVVVAECRYVRPIKGDKVGRVTYQNERNFQFKL